MVCWAPGAVPLGGVPGTSLDGGTQLDLGMLGTQLDLAYGPPCFPPFFFGSPMALLELLSPVPCSGCEPEPLPPWPLPVLLLFLSSYVGNQLNKVVQLGMGVEHLLRDPI